VKVRRATIEELLPVDAESYGASDNARQRYNNNQLGE
jgi:hypothetical protein